jgi:hypothetical protein
MHSSQVLNASLPLVFTAVKDNEGKTSALKGKAKAKAVAKGKGPAKAPAKGEGKGKGKAPSAKGGKEDNGKGRKHYSELPYPPRSCSYTTCAHLACMIIGVFALVGSSVSLAAYRLHLGCPNCIGFGATMATALACDLKNHPANQQQREVLVG